MPCRIGKTRWGGIFVMCGLLKVTDTEKDLEKTADAALAQIDEKRYGQDLDDKKPLVKIGVGLYGKQCLVKAAKAVNLIVSKE